MKFDRTEIVLLVGVVAFLALPTVISPALLDQLLFSIARATAVLGLLVLWRCGLISFGHGLYFGVGGYAVALTSSILGITDLVLRLLVAIVLSMLLALILGFILRRYRSIFFAMLSLAFSMVLYGALVKSEWLGSTDGFSVALLTLAGFHPGSGTRVVLFYVAVLQFGVASLVTHRYLRSIMGAMSGGIRDNELRVEYLGFSVNRTVHINYVLSAALAGLGGAMMAMSIGQVDPDSMVNWTVSGELLFITILSGSGSVIAPVIGSIAFEMLRTYALQVAPQGWHFIVGATLLAIIISLPGGLWSLYGRAVQAVQRNKL